MLQLNAKPRKPQSLYRAANKFYTGGNITLIILNRELACFVLQVRTLFLSTKTVCYANIHEKIVQKKRGQLLALKTCKHVNYLSTTVGSLYLQ